MTPAEDVRKDGTPELLPCPFCGEDQGPLVDATRIMGVWRLIHRCRLVGPILIESSDPEYLAKKWITRADLHAARIAALEARVQELEEGLRPFAGSLAGNYSHQRDSMLISCGHGSDDLRWVLPLGDWRRARALIGEKP